MVLKVGKYPLGYNKNPKNELYILGQILIF